MKRILLSLLAVATIATATSPKIPVAQPFFDAIEAFVVNFSTIFAQAKQNGLSPIELAQLEGQYIRAKIGVAIAHANIKTLQQTPIENLAVNAQVFIESSVVTPGGEGRYGFGAENALGFVLLHSVDNKTAQDHANTIAMLNVLFAKKLNPYAQAGYTYIDKDGRDYVPAKHPTMIELAANLAKRNPCAQTEEIYQLMRTYAEQSEIVKLKKSEPQDPACI